MKYNIAIIRCDELAEWQVDILTQQLADMGFDSFEQEADKLHAYVPTDIVDSDSGFEQALRELLADNQAALQRFEPCNDENWNAVWEAEHPIEELPMGVRITPHCAFGAGHHETTSMMIDQLVERQKKKGKSLITSDSLSDSGLLSLSAAVFSLSSVLDMGTGTGVLAIMAAKLGAEHVVAVDIDENSVRNAIEKAEANKVNIEVLHASNVPQGSYSLIMANIHRNILLEQMHDYAANIEQGGELWISGFYEQDIPALVAEAERQGLQYYCTRANGEWRMLMLIKH